MCVDPYADACVCIALLYPSHMYEFICQNMIQQIQYQHAYFQQKSHHSQQQHQEIRMPKCGVSSYTCSSLTLTLPHPQALVQTEAADHIPTSKVDIMS